MNALVVLVGVIPAVYFVVAFALAATTEVFSPESRIKFALLYGLLAVVMGVSDYYRLRYAQKSPVWLAPRQFVRRVIRGHLITLVFILLGVGAANLFDIDSGWTVVLGFLIGPVTGRAPALIAEYAKHIDKSAGQLWGEIGGGVVVLVLMLAVLLGGR